MADNQNKAVVRSPASSPPPCWVSHCRPTSPLGRTPTIANREYPWLTELGLGQAAPRCAAAAAGGGIGIGAPGCPDRLPHAATHPRAPGATPPALRES
jgi:hypothetical protein